MTLTRYFEAIVNQRWTGKVIAVFFSNIILRTRSVQCIYFQDSKLLKIIQWFHENISPVKNPNEIEQVTEDGPMQKKLRPVYCMIHRLTHAKTKNKSFRQLCLQAANRRIQEWNMRWLASNSLHNRSENILVLKTEAYEEEILHDAQKLLKCTFRGITKPNMIKMTIVGESKDDLLKKLKSEAQEITSGKQGLHHIFNKTCKSTK